MVAGYRKKQSPSIGLYSLTLVVELLTGGRQDTIGLAQVQIAKDQNLSKQTISYYTRIALQQGYIVEKTQSRPRIYVLTEKGEKFLHKHKVQKVSQGVRRFVECHGERFKVPILVDKGLTSWKKRPVNNWVKKYKIVGGLPFDVTLERTTKSIVIYFGVARVLLSPSFERDYFAMRLKALFLVDEYLRSKCGILVDWGRLACNFQHFGTRTPEFEDKVDKSKGLEVGTGRLARSICGDVKDKAGKSKEELVWIDSSKRGGVSGLEVESDGLDYKVDLALMPVRVGRVERVLPLLTEQLSEHLAAVQDIRTGIKELNRLLGKLGKKI